MPTAIEEKHDSLIEDGLDLGEPIGEEETLDDGGSKQVYESGNIYFHPRVGAPFECHGLIRDRYIELGEEKSRLGYPVTDEEDNPTVGGGRMNGFEEGALLFDPENGVSEHFVLPQVVVKFADSIPIRLGQGERLSLDQLADIVGVVGASSVAALGEILPGLEFGRFFDAVSPQVLEELIARATANAPEYVPPNFENCLEIVCPIGFDPDPLVAALAQLPGLVERVQTVVPAEPAGVVGTTNPRFIEQEYLFPGPLGIGVERAWDRGADGTGCRLIDVEHAWLLDPPHEDLPPNITLLDGVNRQTERGHGTAVLGVIAALDNKVGVVGIAPQATISVISADDRSPGETNATSHVAGKILAGVAGLSPGDVLLLEVQIDNLPVETDSFIFDAIFLATLCDVIVVEAAGNKASDLDVVTVDGVHALSRLSSEFKDSGAILVGACAPDVPHIRGSDSNFGTRIDCHAWGEKVLTTGSRFDPVFTNDYFRFSGTSAAAAIIAGVCLLTQHLQKILIGPNAAPLTPKTMRRILSDPNNGTPSNDILDGIGPMPDFTKIIPNEFI
jgi:Subtilase family/LGFP repeat